jgi:hypothetical protein
LRDYLVLLSICETCNYQGLDFLDFLRSGETDIAAFADSRQKKDFDGDIQVPKPRRLANFARQPLF